jgi:hypothetical protein
MNPSVDRLIRLSICGTTESASDERYSDFHYRDPHHHYFDAAIAADGMM